MAKSIYTQVLYGNPTVSGLVRLSIGDTFESSVMVLESTVSAAPLQSAFSGGPYAGGVFQSAAVDEMIGFSFDRVGSEKLFLRLDGAVINGVSLDDPVHSGTITKSTKDVSVASYLAGVATGVAIAQ